MSSTGEGTDAGCERCGAAGQGSRYCTRCGNDRQPDAARLPTADAMEAASLNEAWLREHPEAPDPFAAPERPATPKPAPSVPYRDPTTRARLARSWLRVMVALSALFVLLDIAHLSVLGSVDEVGYFSSSSVAASKDRLAVAAVVLLVAQLLCAGFFIAWMHRAYRNVDALGEHRRFGAGWAIGSWFTPILNLFRPKQIADDIWRAGTSRGPTRLLNVWWGLFIVSTIVDRVGNRLDDGSLHGDRSSTLLDLVSSVGFVACGLLAVRVVGVLSEAHQRRAAEVAVERSSAAPEAVAA